MKVLKENLITDIVHQLHIELKSLSAQANWYDSRLGRIFYERFRNIIDPETEMVRRNIYEIAVRGDQIRN